MIRIKKNNPILIFLVVFGLLVFLHGLGILDPLENFFTISTRPLAEYFFHNGAELNKTYSKRQERDNLIAQLEATKKELALVTIDTAHWREVEEENKKLRSQLNFLSVNNFQSVTASIISREELAGAGGEGDGIIIDRGEKDGIKVGFGVVNEDGIIIGKITELKNNSAKICLTTNPECKLAASLQNESKTQGITDGDLGLTIKMSYIPQLEKISIGDTVITSGLSSNIPRGLVIGKVANVKNESNEIWQEASIEPIVNFNNLTVVSVIIP